MGVTKTIITPGNGVDKAKKGDTITISADWRFIPIVLTSDLEYTGWLYDENANDNKGKQFDTSVGKERPFKPSIGVGEVIRGWDDGVLNVDGGMTLGEKATLVITGDYAYGSRGFPGLIPAHATLVFDVQLKAIGDKKM